MTVRCPDCRGTGIIWKRLTHPWADDGEEHTVMCWACRGKGKISHSQSIGEAATKG